MHTEQAVAEPDEFEGIGIRGFRNSGIGVQGFEGWAEVETRRGGTKKNNDKKKISGQRVSFKTVDLGLGFTRIGGCRCGV